MAPGMSGVKEGSIMKFAEFFASGGFAVLAYDNINFGSSGGEPGRRWTPSFSGAVIGTRSPFLLFGHRRLMENGSESSGRAIPAATCLRSQPTIAG